MYLHIRLLQVLVQLQWMNLNYNIVRFWPTGARLVDLHAHCAEGLPWNVHVQAFVLLALLAWAKWGPRMRPGAA